MKIFLFIFLLVLKNSTFADTVMLPGYKWAHRQITICWASFDDYKKNKGDLSDIISESKIKVKVATKADKVIIQKTIEKNYNIKETGIEFKGWTSCSKTKKPDVLILLDATPEFQNILPKGRADIGTSKLINGEFVYRNGPGTIYLQTNQTGLNHEIALGLIALHEFGHTLGLMHEHLREESKNDLFCKSHLNKEENQNIDQLNVKYNEDYDSVSIMNYCYLRYLSGLSFIDSNYVRLSEKDKRTLKNLYP